MTLGMAMAGWAGTSRLSRQFVSSPGKYFVRACVNRDYLFRQFSVTTKTTMKFVQFTYNNKPQKLCVGLINGDTIVDLNRADSSLPSTFLELLRNGLMDKVKRLQPPDAARVPLAEVRLAAPIHGMDKVICVGLNYRDHCQEQNIPIPEVPMFFSKFASTVIGPNDAVKLRTQVTKCVDWEAELALVIGQEASDVRAQDALQYVAGYTAAQDVSARDWQKKKNGGQFLLGKAMDTFCPMGPWLVTGDELGDPQRLNIKCSVNGTLKQSSNTDQLINKIPDVIARLTSVMTLLPGDVILTGTPGGVGMYRDPPEYLKPGDLVETEIENIGLLTTRIEHY